MPRAYTLDCSAGTASPAAHRERTDAAEKARWALDFEGLAYDEKVLLPGPHQRVTRRSAKASHLPVLLRERRAVQGSSAILVHQILQ